MSTVGEVIFPRNRKYLEWNIPNFSRLPQQSYLKIESPPFYLFGRAWMILMYPNGMSRDGSIALNLQVRERVSECKVGLILGIKHITKYAKKPVPQTFDENTKRYGLTDICSRDTLLRMMEERAIDTLTIYCEMLIVKPPYLSTVADAACQAKPSNRTPVLCRDFQDLLLSGRKSDVTIDVRGQHFKAHRLILETCSSTFAAMFDHDMAEKKNGIVSIEDCDPNTFQNFLKCLYSGKVENVPPDSLMNLYVVADKYCVSDLTRKCGILMAEELCLDTACDVLVLADKYGETELKETAEEFLVQHVKSLLHTDKWRSVMVENSELAVNILTKVIPDATSLNK